MFALFRSREGEEDRPECLDKTGSREGAGQGKEGEADEHDDLEEGIDNGYRREERDKDQDFAGKPVQGRESSNRQCPDKEEGRGLGHPVDEPAHVFDIPRVGGMDNGTGGEEEQALEEGMVEGMEERPEQADGCKFREVVAREDDKEADAHEDDPDILDAAVGEHCLDVMFLEGIDDPEDCRCRPGSQDQEAHGEVQDKHIEQDAEERVYRDLEHDPGHEGRYRRRACRVGIGEPLVERDDAGLDGETEEEADECNGYEGGRQSLRPRRMQTSRLQHTGR